MGLLVLVVVVIVAEVVARVGYGLGDPPLLELDPEIEYLYKPSRTYHYMHHTVAINSHSMRSAEFAEKKTDPHELRVLVIGDSIVTGGGRIDQGELATERLRDALARESGTPVVVGNVACGSWGPPNQLAFVKKFGLFDANIVLIVLNSGDADDVPGLEALGAAWPRSTPVLAVQEPLRRVLERAAPGVAEGLGLLKPSHAPGYDDRVAIAGEALRELVTTAQAAGARVGVVQYWTLSELRGGVGTGHDVLRRELGATTATVWQCGGEGVSGVRFTVDESLFLQGDDVHPSALGQARLGEVLLACVRTLLEGEKSDSAGGDAPSENPPRP